MRAFFHCFCFDFRCCCRYKRTEFQKRRAFVNDKQRKRLSLPSNVFPLFRRRRRRCRRRLFLPLLHSSSLAFRQRRPRRRLHAGRGQRARSHRLPSRANPAPTAGRRRRKDLALQKKRAASTFSSFSSSFRPRLGERRDAVDPFPQQRLQDRGHAPLPGAPPCSHRAGRGSEPGPERGQGPQRPAGQQGLREDGGAGLCARLLGARRRQGPVARAEGRRAGAHDAVQLAVVGSRGESLGEPRRR